MNKLDRDEVLIIMYLIIILIGFIVAWSNVGHQYEVFKTNLGRSLISIVAMENKLNDMELQLASISRQIASMSHPVNDNILIVPEKLMNEKTLYSEKEK